MKEKKEKKPGTHNKVLLEKRGEKKKYIKETIASGIFYERKFFRVYFSIFSCCEDDDDDDFTVISS